jgi:hypothetical protein
MPRNTIPRVIKHYFPNSRRNYGRLLKRFWMRDTGLGQKVPKLMTDMMMMMMMMMMMILLVQSP